MIPAASAAGKCAFYRRTYTTGNIFAVASPRTKFDARVRQFRIWIFRPSGHTKRLSFGDAMLGCSRSVCHRASSWRRQSSSVRRKSLQPRASPTRHHFGHTLQTNVLDDQNRRQEAVKKFGQPLRYRRGSEALSNAINRLQSRECERAVAQGIFSRLPVPGLRFPVRIPPSGRHAATMSAVSLTCVNSPCDKDRASIICFRSAISGKLRTVQA
jgi:hypothetical protein